MASDPRAELRAKIAAKIQEAHERPYFVPDDQDSDDVFFAHLADAVMELFPAIVREDTPEPIEGGTGG